MNVESWSSLDANELKLREIQARYKCRSLLPDSPDLEPVISFYDSLVSLFPDDSELRFLRANAYYYKGVECDDDVQAFAHFMKAYELVNDSMKSLEGPKCNRFVALSCTRLGEILYYYGLFETARSYFQVACEHFESIGDLVAVSAVKRNEAAIYQANKQYEKAISTFALPKCPISTASETKSLSEALGLKAFALFKQKKMAIFFVFSMLLGVSLQITNGFANPFIASFGANPEYADTFGVQHANILVSLSQVSETLCILLIPFFLRKFGIKQVMLIAMFAWVLRFGFFGLGNPGSGVWLFILSMIVYGVAFDFFNISGSLFVDKETDKDTRSSAQGLFMLMTNGVGATIGTLVAQWVVNRYCVWSDGHLVGNWTTVWDIFAAYAMVVAILFAIIFKYKHNPNAISSKN